MRSLKAVLGLAVMAFILAGCGGGSGSSSAASGTSASSSSSVTSNSGSGSGSSSGSGTSSGSGAGSSGSGSGSSGSGSGGGGTTPTTGSAKLSWTAPTANTNGSALTNLAGYYIYYGSSAGSMTNKITVSNPATVSYTVGNLSSGTWYFGIVAYTNSGLQSAMSNVGSKTIT